ncbi:MAG: YdcF family protein, partial [Gemmatimonadaceae bacterium]
SEAVLLESEGRNTDESMRAVAALLRGRGLERVLLVSDPFHMLRLEVLARHYALEPLTSPTRSSPISRNIAELVTYTLGESVKVPWTLGSVAVSQTLNAQSR